MRNHMKSKHKSTEERHMRMQLLREGLACEAKTLRRCIITSTIKARSWATSRPVGVGQWLFVISGPIRIWNQQTAAHPWGRMSPYLSHLRKNKDLSCYKVPSWTWTQGGRCAVLDCSGIFGFIHIENSISAIPGEPFVFKMLWPVAISGVADCWISRREGKCFKLKECSRARRWGEARPCASQPYFNLVLFVDDNSPFMTSVTPGPTEIATAVLFFKELVISLP